MLVIEAQELSGTLQDVGAQNERARIVAAIRRLRQAESETSRKYAIHDLSDLADWIERGCPR